MIELNDFEWRRPRFLLVNFGIEALGVRHLSSFLKKNKCKVNLLFLNHSLTNECAYTYAESVARFIQDENYDIVGFSCMTNDYYEVRSITHALKSKSKRPLIIWGGVHPSICPEECLKDGQADVVFNGSAEISLEELLSGTSLRKTTNVAWLEGDELVSNYSEIAIYPPDSAPFPDFDFEDHFVNRHGETVKMNTQIFRELYPWRGTHYFGITARGCPYRCAYCCNIYRGKIQRKSVEYFLEELVYISGKLPFFQTLSIQDDSLFMNEVAWINEFSEKYRRTINKPLRAALMPRFATHDKLEPLSKAGLTYIGMGLQGSTRLNKEIYGRMETSESFLKAVDSYKRYGIIGRIDVIIDNPYEQKEDLIEIAKTLNEVPKPFPISVFTLTLFPGTRMAERASKDNLSHLFCGNAYKSGLSRDEEKPGVYKTPEVWKRMYQDYLPNLPKNICRYLIDNCNNSNVEQRIIHYSKLPATVNSIGKQIRKLSPKLFDKGFVSLNKRIFGKK